MENSETTEVKPTSGDEKRNEKGVLKTIIIAGLVSSIISVITVIHYDRHYATKVIVMDLDEYTVEQKTKYVEGKLRLEDVKANFAAVKQKIDSYPKNHVLLFNKAVIGGGDMVRFSTTEEEKKDGENQEVK